MTQTIQQERAAYALNEINKLTTTLTAEQQKNFVSYTNNLPAMIHTNGLGQAMAFCKSKGFNEKLVKKGDKKNSIDDKKISYNALYHIVSAWLCKTGQIYAGCETILKGITEKSMHDYQLAQIETLLLMSWLKKFANAFLEKE